MPVPIATEDEEETEEETITEFEPIADDSDDLDTELEMGYADSDIDPWESLLRSISQ